MMARNRMIKPEFWSSEQVVECSPIARLMFVGMWNFADDAGNQPWSSKRLKMLIYPADDFSFCQIGDWVRELIAAGLLTEYDTETRSFLHITGWHHQRIEKPTYRYPPHPGGTNSTSPPGALDEASLPNETKRNETKRNEEKRKEENVRTYDRTVDRSCLDGVDEERVHSRCKILSELIHEAWDVTEEEWDHTANETVPTTTPWHMPLDFAERLQKAAIIVEAGILPWDWLRDATVMLLEGKKKTRPGAWIGKVLASTARERYGVDFDSFKRAITLPKKGGG